MLQFLLICVLLPIMVSALSIHIDPVPMDNSTFMSQGFYMFASKKPSVGVSGDGKSYITVEVSLRQHNMKETAQSHVEVLIIPEDLYRNIGYEQGDNQIVCCDAVAFKEKRCSNPDRLILANPYNMKYTHKELDFLKNDQTIIASAEIEEDGKYYVVIGSCDPGTKNMDLSGMISAVNYYGHLPARQYGLYPFLRWILLIYIILLAFWLIRCCIYHGELLSVHVMISLVLVLAVGDLFLQVLTFAHFNASGDYSFPLTFMSLFASALYSTVSLCLIIAISKGLGVSRATLGGEFWTILLLGILLFVFTLWDGISSTFNTASRRNLWRIIPSAMVSITMYAWILKSLQSTIEELETRKQTGKLQVFVQLRRVIITVVILSMLYNIAYSYVIIKEIINSLWKYQWFFNDGVWSVYHLGITICIMYLWSPNELSVAYAYHHQVATDEYVEVEEYEMPEVELQSVAGGKLEVTVVNGEKLKPMEIYCVCLQS